MLFTFKRDAEDRERVYAGDVAIARINDRNPEGFDWLAAPPAGVDADHVVTAKVMADEAGFWGTEWCDDCSCLVNRKDEVTVDVPIPETTSTILSITNTEDRS